MLDLASQERFCYHYNNVNKSLSVLNENKLGKKKTSTMGLIKNIILMSDLYINVLFIKILINLGHNIKRKHPYGNHDFLYMNVNDICLQSKISKMVL